jgi:pyruvate dehydrogenase E1 component alpha subunit/2-oxoisovalerate dehydrogenase E1 component alpha subunit
LGTAEQQIESAAQRPLFIRAYRWMLLGRFSEERLASLYRGGKIIGGVFLGRGQEALSTSLAIMLRPGDIYAPLIRDQSGRLAFGETLIDSFRTYLGSRLGPMRGRDGNIHRGAPRQGILPMISHLGAMVSTVNGALMAHRFRGIAGTVGATSLGDGATSTGSFHEGLNQAAVEKLPLVITVANNQYAYSTPNSRQFVCRDLIDKAIGYGVEGHSVDGTDLAECLEVMDFAVNRARHGHGPQMVVASLLRLVGHGEHDDASYVDPALREMPFGRDCIEVAEKQLLERGWADRHELDQWAAEASQQVDEAVAVVSREPSPNPAEEDWCAISSRNLVDGFANE